MHRLRDRIRHLGAGYEGAAYVAVSDSAEKLSVGAGYEKRHALSPERVYSSQRLERVGAGGDEVPACLLPAVRGEMADCVADVGIHFIVMLVSAKVKKIVKIRAAGIWKCIRVSERGKAFLRAPAGESGGSKKLK